MTENREVVNIYFNDAGSFRISKEVEKSIESIAISSTSYTLVLLSFLDTNGIDFIDVSACQSLKVFTLNYSLAKKINLQQNKQLKTISLASASYIEECNIDGETLESLNLYKANKLTKLNFTVSKLSNLVTVTAHSNTTFTKDMALTLLSMWADRTGKTQGSITVTSALYKELEADKKIIEFTNKNIKIAAV